MELETIIQEVKNIGLKLGCCPVAHDLLLRGCQSVLQGIIESGHSIAKLQAAAGFTPPVRPMHYWDQFENVAKEISPFVVNGKFPSEARLIDTIGPTIRTVFKKHGGYVAVAAKMGYAIEKKPRTTWTTALIEERLKDIVQKLGYFPKQSELRLMGESGLTKAMELDGMSISMWQKRLGFSPRRRRRGYWSEWSNLEKEIIEVMEKCNTADFPTIEVLRQTSGSTAIAIAVAQHGGIGAVATRLGFESARQLIATDGHCVDSYNELIFDEILYAYGIPHEVNKAIIENDKAKYRYDFKVGDLYFEIWGYNGDCASKFAKRYQHMRNKKEKYYADHNIKLVSVERTTFSKPMAQVETEVVAMLAHLGLDVSEKKYDNRLNDLVKRTAWWTKEKVVKRIRKAMKETNEFPTYKFLRDNSLADLASAVNQFGGFDHFREIVEARVRQQAKSQKWSEADIIKEIKTIMDGDVDFPSYDALRSAGRYDLIRAINRNGGYTKFQELLGLEPKRAKNGSWTDEKIITGIQEVADLIGRTPTYTEVRTANRTLTSAIDRSKKGMAYFLSLRSISSTVNKTDILATTDFSI